MVSFALKLEDELMTQVRLRAEALGVDEETLIVKALQSFLYLDRINKVREKLEEKFREGGIHSEEEIYEQVS